MIFISHFKTIELRSLKFFINHNSSGTTKMNRKSKEAKSKTFHKIENDQVHHINKEP